MEQINKKIYFCIDPESYTEQMITNPGAAGYHDYLQTQEAINNGISPIVTSNVVFLDYSLIGRGYDIYLCYTKNTIKIEENMKIPVRYVGNNGPVVKDTEINVNMLWVYVSYNKRRFDSLLDAFLTGVFHEVLGIKSKNNKSRI